jgi:glyoxylase-like metal-dependent hydrolase (beta-lactamase superfamily II)
MLILEQLITGYIGTNCYLFGDDATKDILIIDPGGDAPKIIEHITTRGYHPIAIVITHGHPDHTEAAPELAQKYSIPVKGSEKLKLRKVATFLPVKEGDSISCGSIRLDVTEAPGHSKDAIMLFDYSNKLIFVGDNVFQGSIGRTDLGGNYAELMQSIREKIMRNPKVDDTFRILPGHMDLTSVGEEKHFNPFKKDFL